MAEGNGLLNRRRGKTSTEGSNPSLSATVGLLAPSEPVFALKKTMGRQVPERLLDRGRYWLKNISPPHWLLYSVSD